MLVIYSLRSIWARRASVIAPLLAALVSIGGASCAAAYLQGFRDVLSHTSRRIAVIASAPIMAESDSAMSREQMLRMAALARGQQHRAPAADVVDELPCNDGAEWFRGVAANSGDAHGGVSLPDGLLKDGVPGVIVGAKLAAGAPALRPPRNIRIGDTQLPILGVLEAPGTPYESEIWAAHSTLTSLHLVSGYSTLRMEVADEAELGSIREEVARMFRGTMEVRSERDFFDYVLARAGSDSHLALVTSMLVLLAIAGLVANVNTMYSVALSRRSEFFTLSILGFSRMRIIGLVLQESLLVNFVGGLLGLLCARALTDARIVEYGGSGVMTSVHFSPLVCCAALALIFAIGIIGGAVAALQAIGSHD